MVNQISIVQVVRVTKPWLFDSNKNDQTCAHVRIIESNHQFVTVIFQAIILFLEQSSVVYVQTSSDFRMSSHPI